MSRLHAAQSPLPLMVSNVKYCYILQNFYLPLLARTRIRFRRRRGDTESELCILDTPPPSKNPSSKKFLPLYADDSDEPPRDSDDDDLTSTYLPLYVNNPTTSVIADPTSAIANSEDEYDVFSDIELTDELIATLDKTQSEDEYDVFSDIELTDELIATLDKTQSEDEFAMSDSDIEFTDELIAILDKTHSEDELAMSDIELTDNLIAALDQTY
jgi:hypothetical protein